MRGVYTVSFFEQTIASASGDYDLFELTPADDIPIEIVALTLGQKSEVGDAQAEMLSYRIISDNATTGNGTATTPRPTDSRGAAASFTAETVASTPASTGTEIALLSDTFHVASGLRLVFPPEMRFRVDQADTMLVVRFPTAAADDLTLSGTIWVKEL